MQEKSPVELRTQALLSTAAFGSGSIGFAALAWGASRPKEQGVYFFGRIASSKNGVARVSYQIQGAAPQEAELPCPSDEGASCEPGEVLALTMADGGKSPGHWPGPASDNAAAYPFAVASALCLAISIFTLRAALRTKLAF